MISTALLAVWIFWIVVALVLYHKAFSVYYFNLGKGIIGELIYAGIAGGVMTCLTFYLWKLTAIIIIIVGLVNMKRSGNVLHIVAAVVLAIVVAYIGIAAAKEGKNDDTSNVSSTQNQTTSATVSDNSTAQTTSKQNNASKTDNNTKSTTKSDNSTGEYNIVSVDNFYDGLAWATISDTTSGKSKTVLINSNLQVVYQIPTGVTIGSVLNGKAITINSDQNTNPGFNVIGTDGSVLYKCSDYLEKKTSPTITKDGSIVYTKRVSNMTDNSAYACILNNKFENIAQIKNSGSHIINEYYYVSDGIYLGKSGNANESYLINASNGIIESLTWLGIDIYIDDDYCVGIKYTESRVDYLVKADTLNYENVTSASDFRKEVMAKGIKYNQYINSSYEFKNHSFFSLRDFSLPDFGATISSAKASSDLEYFALVLKGADGKYYITTVNKKGEQLYEPFVLDSELDVWEYAIVCNGYVIYYTSSTKVQGISPGGKRFVLGDGSALAGIGNDFVERSSAFTSDNYGKVSISDGYITSGGSLYNLDGRKVKTIQMAK